MIDGGALALGWIGVCVLLVWAASLVRLAWRRLRRRPKWTDTPIPQTCLHCATNPTTYARWDRGWETWCLSCAPADVVSEGEANTLDVQRRIREAVQRMIREIRAGLRE